MFGGPSAASSRTDPLSSPLKEGRIYRLRSQSFGGYDHAPDYADGNFIHVQVLGGPDKQGCYRCTTRGEDGKHLGPGGGWTRDLDKDGLLFSADQLETLPAQAR